MSHKIELWKISAPWLLALVSQSRRSLSLSHKVSLTGNTA
jgi:hypothetical protein